MAAITSAVVAGGAAIAQTVSGISNTQKAKDAIDNFQRQELTNPFENIQISTLKADQQTEANLVNFASSVDALQRGGSRAILGGLPRLNQQNILLQNIISQDLDRQDQERQRLIANGELRIQNIQEQREERALQGLGQQLQTGRQDTFSGLTNLASAALSFGSALNETPKSTTRPKVESVSTLQPRGIDTSIFQSAEPLITIPELDFSSLTNSTFSDNN